MSKGNTIIDGKIDIDGTSFDAEIINHTLVIRCDYIQPKEIKAKLLRKTIKFVPLSKGAPDYYLYIDKKEIDQYSYYSFHILLLYRHFNDTKEIAFEILSKGFTNALNKPHRQTKDPLKEIKNNLGKPFLRTNVCISGQNYKIAFANIGLIDDNNLCPVSFTTSLLMIPEDGIFSNKIANIFEFALHFLQFITLNTYPVIDSFIIRNDVGGFAEIEIDYDFSECDKTNDKYLYIRCFNGNIDRLINLFPNVIYRQHNLFHYKRGWVFEFDIVRLSGTFEGVFDECVKENDRYLKVLKKKKRIIQTDKLIALLKKFAKDNKIKNNNDFNSYLHLLETYGGTFKDKLGFVLNDFRKTLDLVAIDSSFFYSAIKFESRIRDSRNSICHGSQNNKIEWNRIGNDTLLLQELVYYVVWNIK